MIDFETIKNWNTFSEQTKTLIKTAYTQKVDAVGLLIQKEPNLSISNLVEAFQSLADPKYAGLALSKNDWNSVSDARFSELTPNVSTFADEKFRSHCLKARESTVSNIQFPLALNYCQNGSIFTDKQQKSSRYNKLVNMYKENLGISVKELPSWKKSSDFYIYKDNTIFLYDKGLGECEKIALLNSVIANIKLNTNRVVIANACQVLSDREIELVKNILHEVLTLALMRATELGDAEASYKIDEALKLQIANSLCLFGGNNKTVSRIISSQIEQLLKQPVRELKFDIERIKSNMVAMGYEYAVEPKTAFEAIFAVNNLKKCFDLDFEKSQTRNCFASAVIGTGAKTINLNNLKSKVLALEGFIKNSLVKKDEVEDIYLGEYQGNVVDFILQNRKGNYKTAQKHAKTINDKLVTSCIATTLGYIDEMGQDIGTSNPKTALKKALNAEYKKSINDPESKDKSTKSLINKKFKDTIKETIHSTDSGK